jgi:hypothetical protein
MGCVGPIPLFKFLLVYFLRAMRSCVGIRLSLRRQEVCTRPGYLQPENQLLWVKISGVIMQWTKSLAGLFLKDDYPYQPTF